MKHNNLKKKKWFLTDKFTDNAMKEEKFLQKINEIYNGNIEILSYENTKGSSMIKCRCKIHGDFSAKVHNLIYHKSGCPLCSAENSNSPYKTTEQLVYKLRKKYGDVFLYDKVSHKENKIKLICPIHGEFAIKANYALRNNVICPICKYESQRQHINMSIDEVEQEAYSKWNNMFIRCYNKKYQEKTPSYKGCEVCEEWKLFDNFYNWFKDPQNGYRKNYHLDKDLLVQGNKIYSPETCCFVPQTVNSMMTRNQRIRGKVKSIGVTFRRGKYIARCNFGHKEAATVGVFDNEQDAFIAYKKAKEGYIKNLAEDLFSKEMITEKVYNALLKYDVKQYD